MPPKERNALQKVFHGIKDAGTEYFDKYHPANEIAHQIETGGPVEQDQWVWRKDAVTGYEWPSHRINAVVSPETARNYIASGEYQRGVEAYNEHERLMSQARMAGRRADPYAWIMEQRELADQNRLAAAAEARHPKPTFEDQNAEADERNRLMWRGRSMKRYAERKRLKAKTREAMRAARSDAEYAKAEAEWKAFLESGLKASSEQAERFSKVRRAMRPKKKRKKKK